MTQINIEPYSRVENKRYTNNSLLIINSDAQPDNGSFLYTFSDCDFNTIEIKNFNEIECPIVICFNYCFINQLIIEQLQSDNISILIFGSILSGNIKNVDNFQLNNCIVENLFVSETNSVSINYTEENIFPIKWRRLVNRNGLSDIAEMLKQKQSFYLENIKDINFWFHEIDSPERGLRKRDNEPINEYKIVYYFREEEKKELNINLSIKYNFNFIDKSTKINNAYLYGLMVSGKPNGEITIEDSRIHRIYLHNFSTQGEFSLHNISPLNNILSLTKFEIHKSNLINSWFNDVDFSKYSIVSFYRSRFNKATFTSCSFPSESLSFEKFKSLENVHYPDKVRQSYYKDQYEIFLQLTDSLENTGNFYEAQKMKAISHKALKKIKNVDFWDKIILFLNEVSNSHGLSIKKPLTLFIIGSIALYLLYLLSLGMLFNNNDIDWSLFSQYFSFIDITHKNDFLVKNDDLTFWSEFINFSSKILLGYFIYQFIAAFRKYGKR